MRFDDMREYALLYGAKISQWPQDLQDAAKELLSNNPLAVAWLEREGEFESIARNRLPVGEIDGFAERIIAAAASQPRKISWLEKLRVIMAELQKSLPIPQPAYAFSIILLAGFIFGTALDSVEENDALNGLLYETSEVI